LRRRTFDRKPERPTHPRKEKDKLGDGTRLLTKNLGAPIEKNEGKGGGENRKTSEKKKEGSAEVSQKKPKEWTNGKRINKEVL